MAIMTAQLPLMLVPAGAVQIGEIAALVEDETGGRVFIRGELVFAWNAGDELGRRLAAVQLVAIKGARAVRVAEGFGINTETLRRWDHAAANDGIAALVPGRRGPKGPSRLSPAVVADIRARRRGGASLRAIATAVGVSEATVRRALPAAKPEPEQDETTSTDINDDDTCGDDADDDQGTSGADQGAEDDLPLLPPPADRGAERAAARWGKLPHADPVFAPAARVPLAGLLLAIPALQTTGLLSCATQVFGCLPNGFYGLDTMLLEGVLRALAGEPRVEGATRVDPAALGRVLGLDRGPEVKTIRRKITTLAGTGRAGELLAAMASAHVARLDASDPDLLAVFYVDGHVRAYQGGAKIAKTHSSRLKFPAPATVETWVSDASGLTFRTSRAGYRLDLLGWV
jgi:transposase